MEDKFCKKCQVTKSFSEFGRKKGGVFRTVCKECENKYQRIYYALNIEKCRTRNATYQRKLRRIPKEAKKLRVAQKRCWQSGGRERQQAYLDRLKKADFFKWKSRKSYIFLSAKQLKSLWDKQQGHCALTGRPLGKDPQLDHIIPKTRGGTDCYENSRWLCEEANQAKRNLLDSEFLQLCREVMLWEGGPTQNL
ncbi:MAG TPA: HNH endonuclease [Leeuwenhoekiella sp.]|nr:HNH endonuclease [Leeuwenhoekiella sp.]